MRISKLSILLLFVVIILGSCRKDIRIEVDPPQQIHEPTIKVVSSVIGTVLDQDNIPVENAAVKLDEELVFTDKYGVFQFKNINMFADGTYIKVVKDGYFLGSRTFYPTLGTESFVSVVLMKEELVGNFNSNSGGVVQFEGVSVKFPSDGIVSLDGSNYSGNVQVYGAFIDPTLSETANTMPGDLTAVNQAGDFVTLSSLSMFVLELKDVSGGKLQLKEGKPAETVFPIPAILENNAPASIPLWFFDEDQGIWIEDGLAVKDGDNYIGSVSHFSFWNCDIPFPSVFLDGFVYNFDSPLINAKIVINDLSAGTSGIGYTDENGKFSGFVPSDVVLEFNVYNVCEEVIYTDNIGPFSEDISYNAYVETTVLIASVFGSVSSCAGSISDYAYVIASVGERNYIINLDDSDGFESDILYCSDSDMINVKAYDPINGLVSQEVVMTAVPDVNVADLELCDSLITEHVLIEYGDVRVTLDPNTGMDYTVNTIYDQTTGLPTKYLLTMTFLNWTTGDVVTQTFVVKPDLPEQAGSMHTWDGFIAYGVGTNHVVNQDGENWAIMTGTYSDMDIYDEDLYDESYNPLYFHIAVKLQ